MRIISFAWTTPAVVMKVKSVTRRTWDSKYAKTFYKGEVLQAWDKSPRYGGKKFGEIQLVEQPYQQNMINAPDSDYILEGFEFMAANNIKCGKFIPTPAYWRAWKASREIVWVVRFQILNITDNDLLNFCKYSYNK
jgi:hypothetical protein